MEAVFRQKIIGKKSRKFPAGILLPQITGTGRTVRPGLYHRSLDESMSEDKRDS
jgi:hypothetical protein